MKEREIEKREGESRLEWGRDTALKSRSTNCINQSHAHTVITIICLVFDSIPFQFCLKEALPAKVQTDFHIKQPSNQATKKYYSQ